MILNEILMRDTEKNHGKKKLVKRTTINNEALSIKQVAYFMEKATIIQALYDDRKTLNPNDTILINSKKLENYKIKVDGEYIRIVDINTNFQYGYFSLGNKKLKRDIDNTYIIWNITQKTSCQYKTKECDRICYADNYPNNLQRNLMGRHKNLILSTFTNFEEIFLEVIEIVNKIFSTNIWIRIHESGDFYNLAYFRKIVNICNSNSYNNVALAYTKNLSLIGDINKLDENSNISVRYSIMSDTTENNQRLVLKNDLNTFICANMENNNNIPVCGDNCSTCHLCYDNTIKNIIVKPHGKAKHKVKIGGNE
ncbi:MAG: hypothetical protein RSB54_02795 [Bacilli bacterium]